MVFIIIGIVFIAMHFLGVGAPARWSWAVTEDLWKFISPFLLALAWWFWSDASGRTAKDNMSRDAERKLERRRRTIASLGLGNRRSSSTPKDR